MFCKNEKKEIEILENQIEKLKEELGKKDFEIQTLKKITKEEIRIHYIFSKHSKWNREFYLTLRTNDNKIYPYPLECTKSAFNKIVANCYNMLVIKNNKVVNVIKKEL